MIKHLGNNIYFDDETKSYMHKTKIKCIINPFLRFVQFYTNKPYVIASICDIKTLHFDRYIFRRVTYKGEKYGRIKRVIFNIVKLKELGKN